MAMSNSVRDLETGRFVRLINFWDGLNWDEGYLDNRGRLRVYRPDYPNPMKEGYASRAHVVWWLAHGICPSDGMDVHHKNGDRTDDRLENLQLMPHGKHSSFHNAGPEMTILFCPHCQQEFRVPSWRLRQHWKDGYGSKYCSLRCYHAAPRTKEHNRHIGEGNVKAWAEGRRTTGRKHEDLR